MDALMAVGGMFWVIAILIFSAFLIIWPILIWSHLREQTKYLSIIARKIGG